MSTRTALGMKSQSNQTFDRVGFSRLRYDDIIRGWGFVFVPSWSARLSSRRTTAVAITTSAPSFSYIPHHPSFECEPKSSPGFDITSPNSNKRGYICSNLYTLLNLRLAIFEKIICADFSCGLSYSATNFTPSFLSPFSFHSSLYPILCTPTPNVLIRIAFSRILIHIFLSLI